MNGHMTDFFNVISCSARLFTLPSLSLFINDMVRKVNALGKGVALVPDEQKDILL